MCGIAGFFRPAGLIADEAKPGLDRMSASLSHRGPDDSGVWIDAAAGIALGHRRLSILDLSPAGHQPMTSASGRFVIAFNGEIYNHSDMRKEIDSAGSAPPWRGHSDTEILLSAFDRWGIEPSLKRAVGMFAFALWDRQERTLTLARDRVGEKPLYYGWQGDALLFGSELKALRAHPGFFACVDRDVLTEYFRRGYITAPQSIYHGISKLLPGCYVQFSGQAQRGIACRPRAYWSLREVAERGLAEPFEGSDAEATGRLESELQRAVAGQRIADVPLGAFLSGGIDSSTIVALMQAQSSRRVKTFTIGFHEDRFDEANHARSVARQLGTDHTELVVTAREAMEVIPRLASIYDEPFGDSSAIPTFLVSQLARQHVTVALSGDGGDELFGGYGRYQRTSDIWSVVRRVPYFMRRTASLGANALSKRSRTASTRAKALRLARYLYAQNASAIYQTQMTQRHDAQEFVVANGRPRAEFVPEALFPRDEPYSGMMYADASTYLPDDILVKVDRASMAVGLEARVPMLDHRIFEFAWQLPLRFKVRGQTRKWLLKQVLRKYLPDSLMERPKMGFGVPVGEWVRGPLREWAESLLCEVRLRGEGFLNTKLAREQWLCHLAGDSSGSDSLWHVLAFQSWLASVAVR
jgi:asparagine synthase (glutamine-hydrolysing)